MKYISKASILSFMLAFVFGAYSIKSTASICDETIDWQDVNFYDGTLGVTKQFVSAHKYSVGMLTRITEDGLAFSATSFLISPDLFLTSAHNFINSSIVVTPENEAGVLSSINPSNIYITMGNEYAVDGSILKGTEYSVIEIEELLQYEDEHGVLIDYAIVRVNGRPGNDFNIVRLSPEIPSIALPVAIIQHPSSEDPLRPKKIATGFTDGYGSPFDGLLRHTVDTEAGSSGSPVLNYYGKTIAMHNKGLCDKAEASNFGLLIADIAYHSSITTELINHDNDNDGYISASDNCPITPNSDQSDLDEDGFGNACDIEYIVGSLIPIISMLL